MREAPPPRPPWRLVAGAGLAIAAAAAVWSFRAQPFIVSYALLALAGILVFLGLGGRGGGLAKALWFAASLLVCVAALDAEIQILFFPRIDLQGRGGAFIVSDPVLGYGPRPGARAKVAWRRLGKVIYDARYTIDPQGFRATAGSADPKASTTVFLGDSYTFGDGLNDADTLPQQFSGAIGGREKVINTAFSGYGPNQVLALMESDRLSARLGAGPRLFVYSAIDEHLGRTGARFALQRAGIPRYELVDGRLRQVGAFHPGVGGALLALASKSAIVAGIRDLSLAAPSGEAAPLFGAMVQAAREAAGRRYGASFLVILWDEPVWQDGGDPVRGRKRAAATAAMAEEMDRRGVPFIRVSSLVPDYPAHTASYVLAGSGHPSALLNRRLALALARLIDRPTSAATNQSQAHGSLPVG